LAAVAALAMLMGAFAPQAWLEATAREPKRRALFGVPAVVLAAPLQVSGFSPADLGQGQVTNAANSRKMGKGNQDDPKRIAEALYLISRVQEATVQQERLVTSGKFKDVQRNSITMALNLMLNNYALNDQVVIASAYTNRADQMQKAGLIGLEAVEALESAKEYFGTSELKVSGITDVQRKFVIEALVACRTKLDAFLEFMPAKQLQAARARVEEENALNVKEFVGQDGVTAMSNPVTLPWKTKKP